MKNRIMPYLMLLTLCVSSLSFAEPQSEEAVIYDLEMELATHLLPVAKMLGARHLHDQPVRIGRNAEFPHTIELGRKSDGDKRHRTNLIVEGVSFNEDTPERGVARVFEGAVEQGARFSFFAGPEAVATEVSRNVNSYKENYFDVSKSSAASVKVINSFKVHAEGGIKGVGSARVDEENETTVEASTASSEARGERVREEIQLEVSFDVEIPPYETRIYVIDVKRSEVSTPIKRKGRIEFSFRLDAYNWAGNYSELAFRKGKHWNIAHFVGFEDLEWFLTGQRKAEFPGMGRFMAECKEVQPCKAAVAWLLNPKNRELSAKGHEVRNYPYDTAIRTLGADGKPILK